MPHAIEIIGEATSRVSRPFCAVHPETPWSEVTGLRHRIVHDYFALDYGRPSDTDNAIRLLLLLCQSYTATATLPAPNGTGITSPPAAFSARCMVLNTDREISRLRHRSASR